MLSDLIETWTTEPSKRKWIMSYLPIILSMALVCLIAWQLANIYWSFKAPVVTSNASPVTLKNVPQTKSSSVDINKITSANLFGAYQAQNIEPDELDLTDVADTTLNLNLHGTLLSDISEQSRAIIEVDGKDKVFSIGEEIQKNVSLYAVESNQVILDNRGKKEALRLPREEETAGPTQGRVQARTSSKTADRIARDMRNSALKNPSSITDILRLKKGQTSTGQKGFRVYPGKNRTRFKELGLKPGDFVTQVNGLSVGDQNPFQVIQTLGTSTFINLSIERNGQLMNLSFDIGQTQ